LVGGEFEARAPDGFVVGKYKSLTDAYNSLLARSGVGGDCK
jgi:hypothetical protein